MMKNRIMKIGATFIGITEILIGTVTLCVCIAVQFFHINGLQAKPSNVFIFVILAALAAVVLGAGLILGKKWARKALIFFSSYILFSKILIYAHLLSFKGTIATFIPDWSRDLISVIYHSALILFLSMFPENNDQ